MKKIWICAILCITICNSGKNAIRMYTPVIEVLPEIQFIRDTLPSDSSASGVIKEKPQVPFRTKSVQSKDYRYGRNNMFSFIFAVLSIFCLVLLIATASLNLPLLSVIMYLGHVVFLVLSLIKGIKGLKEKKMNILGYLGLAYSGCMGLSILISLGMLLLSLFVSLIV